MFQGLETAFDEEHTPCEICTQPCRYNNRHSRCADNTTPTTKVAEGQKHDGGKVRLDLILQDFSYALEEIAKAAMYGEEKYVRGNWLKVSDLERRYLNAQLRHAQSRMRGETLDPESGVRHLAHEIWNAMAQLEYQVRNHK